MRNKKHAFVLLTISALATTAQAKTEPAASSQASAKSEQEITEIAVTAPEPRYVAPTLRDRLGRIWAPVYLNGKGPFRMVLDTGASRSAINAQTAQALGFPPAGVGVIMLHGVTGSANVAYVKIDTFVVGDMEAHNRLLPIVPDALGGADGVLGMEGLEDKRIFIDFMHDKITISRSHGRRAEYGYETIPLTRTANGLLMTTAYMGGVRVKAIIDTGGQVTVANLALQTALRHRHPKQDLRPTSIIGATDDEQAGQEVPVPPISLGPVTIRAPFLTVSDLQIFDVWKMNSEPTMLIGIDTLGLLDNLVIDYRRMELQIRTRHNN